MATLIAAADGNLTSAATWGAVDATSLLDSEANNTVLTTSYVSSSVFAPGAITIDGIAVKIATRAAVPAGTMSVQLFNSTAAAAVAGTEVTINVSDIVQATLGFNGWLFVKFAAPVLLLAATDYTVQAKSSSATQVNLYRNATANNWSRMLRTTTTGAPGAGDNFFILGEWTAAATKTNRAVTMNETASTDYGGGSTTVPSVGISNGGTLTWGTTAATNYILRLSGILRVWAGGVYQMGTTGTPVPVDSSAQLEFDCAVDGDFGLRITGTGTAQGSPRTAANLSYMAFLNTDEAAAQTVLGLDRDTGWKSGDDVVIEATSIAASQTELRTLSGDAGVSSITVTAGLTNAHSGTSPTQGAVALLTRNVRIRAVTTTFTTWVHCDTIGIVDFDWVEIRYIGLSATVGKRGVELETTTGSATFHYCSIRNSEVCSFYVTGTAHDNITIDSCVMFMAADNSGMFQAVSATTGTTLTLSNSILLNTTSLQNQVLIQDAGWSFINNRVCATAAGAVVAVTETAILTGTWSGNVIHSSGAAAGLLLTRIKGGTISSTTIYRCGASTGGLGLSACNDLLINGVTVFGCTGNNLHVNGTSTRNTIRNGVSAGDTTAPTSVGLDLGDANGSLRLENCTFGVASGIFVAHTGSDISAASFSNVGSMDLFLINCVLASATEIGSRTLFKGRGAIHHQRVDGVTNVHKTDYPALGLVEYEATVFRTAAPSEKMTPSAAPTVLRLQSSRKRIPVASGKAITVGVYVRKSAAYTGSAPRLIMAANPALGIDNDIVLDTFTAAADTWEQLTGTQTPVAEEDGVVECYIDCDGSAGIVYLDDWSAVTT